MRGVPLLDKDEFGRRVREALVARGLSYRKGAVQIGVSYTALHRVAADHRTPGPETYLRLERWLASAPVAAPGLNIPEVPPGYRAVRTVGPGIVEVEWTRPPSFWDRFDGFDLESAAWVAVAVAGVVAVLILLNTGGPALPLGCR
jgi:transcriptional regulator with XRE-family HTH domain